MSKLALICLDEYRRDDLISGFQAAFSQLDLASVFSPAERILIKPNFLAATLPESAVSPHPAVFEALAQCLADLKLVLSYGDSPALDSIDKAVRLSGFAEVADQMGITLADFESSVDTVLPEGRVLRQMPLAKGVAEADGLVSLSKLKTHALTRMTGAIKNQFGVVVGQRKALYHANFPDQENFCQMLVDINKFLKPRLYVMDAIVAMEGNGPRNGRPRKVGAVLISTDPAALDAAGAFLMGLSPDSVATTRLAAAAGLGEINLANIEACLIYPAKAPVEIKSGPADQMLAGLQVKDFAVGRLTHSVVNMATTLGAPLFKRFIQQRPAVDATLCTCCGVCEKACPLDPKTVHLPGNTEKPVFDYAHCIRCYCCQETCPFGAIKVQKTLVGKLIRS